MSRERRPSTDMQRAAIWVDRLGERLSADGGEPEDATYDLLTGKLRVVHCFETTNRRYLIAAEQPDARPLTHREREVLVLAARGLSNKAIAHQLAISTGAVGSYLSVAMGKIGVRSRRVLVRYFGDL
jgi:DNA-binding NarL/FixJ family response regulator